MDTRISHDKNLIIRQQWPAHPLLFMVHVHRVGDDWHVDGQHALLFAGDMNGKDGKVTLYLGGYENLLTAHGKTWEAVLAKFPQIKFADLDTMLKYYTVE